MRLLGGIWGHVPQEKFWFQTFWDRFWCHFGVKLQELNDLLPNLVIVIEAFKRSLNLKTWLRFTPQRRQNSRKAQKTKKKILASYCTCSVVALCSWEIQVLQCGFCVYTIVSVGHSVRSYICADLLSICEDSPSKEEFHGTHGTALYQPLDKCPLTTKLH